jgi:hypothetical protein
MLCWDNNESQAREYHVLAKITECNTKYPFKCILNENTYPEYPNWVEEAGRRCFGFLYAKPIPETIELTVDQICKILGKTVKIIK